MITTRVSTAVMDRSESSAVAAALQFTREVKNPAYAPADTTPDREKLSEMAA